MLREWEVNLQKQVNTGIASGSEDHQLIIDTVVAPYVVSN